MVESVPAVELLVFELAVEAVGGVEPEGEEEGGIRSGEGGNFKSISPALLDTPHPRGGAWS